MTREDDRDDVGAAALEGVALIAGFAVPGFGVAARRLARAVRVEHERRQSVALAAAEHLSGLTREDLAEQIAEDPRLHPLLVRLLHAAGTNGYDRTLRAMGAALGDAVRERDRVDECDLLLQALDGLGADHAALLDLIASPPPGVDWTSSDLEAQAASLTGVLCLPSLLARGLTVESKAGVGHFSGPLYVRLTPAGQAVLGVLREHAAREGK